MTNEQKIQEGISLAIETGTLYCVSNAYELILKNVSEDDLPFKLIKDSTIEPDAAIAVKL